LTNVISLQESYKNTNYQLSGHGPRNVDVLKEVLEQMDASQLSDIYGNGEIIDRFEKKMATYLGKESAVFFPSGTMAQQIALRIWCDQKGIKKVAYHPFSHLEIHEEDGLKELHHIQPLLLADRDRVIDLDDVMNLQEDIACLLLELPQREIGGQLPDFNMLEEISIYCRERGIKLHLDGARLYEILPFYQKTAEEICELFDSVYISFYKGIGGIAGAILAGEKAFTEKSKVWKRRHGGDLISLYPYILAADYYFEKRIHKMEQYFEGAKELAAHFNQGNKMKTLPSVPVSNMFHVHFNASIGMIESILVNIHQETNIGFTANLRETSEGCYFELSVGDQFSKIPKELLIKAFQILEEQS
jgi:threonine aldolase